MANFNFSDAPRYMDMHPLGKCIDGKCCQPELYWTREELINQYRAARNEVSKVRLSVMRAMSWTLSKCTNTERWVKVIHRALFLKKEDEDIV